MLHAAFCLSSKRFLLAVLASVAVAGGSTAQAADKWPARPIRVVVPYVTGSSGEMAKETPAWKTMIETANVKVE